MSIIVILETFAALFYLAALILFIKAAKKESAFGKIIFSVVSIAMILGVLISLTDVFQWGGISVLLVEHMEEIFTPLFGLCWLIASMFLFILIGEMYQKTKE